MGRKAANPDAGTDECTGQQRAGMVTAWLIDGEKMKTRHLARRFGITTQGAGKMMKNLSAKLPIVQEDGYWQWMEKG